mmetsp:Transcript_6061/g.9471  ORF Transcript_6061/g.9471 Transcript_6061/m.9471 type:complete len:160 (-) Transcript_6061:78-557(-)
MEELTAVGTRVVSSTPQRHLFVVKHLGSSMISALVCGVGCGVVGSTFFAASIGPLVPYLVGSTVGFALSSYSMWTSELEEAYFWSKRYPRLIEHQLNFGFAGMNIGPIDVRSADIARTASLAQKTWLILSCANAQADIQQIESNLRERLVEHLSELADD